MCSRRWTKPVHGAIISTPACQNLASSGIARGEAAAVLRRGPAAAQRRQMRRRAVALVRRELDSPDSSASSCRHQRVAAGLGEDRGGADRAHARIAADDGLDRAVERQVGDARAAIAVDLARASGTPAVPSSARRIARNVACRMLRQSISSRSAQPTAHASARSRISGASRSRSRRSAPSNRASPRMRRRGSRITAAATTGPASGPRPASSTPATRADQPAARASHRRPRSRRAPSAFENRPRPRAPAPPRRSARCIARNSLLQLLRRAADLRAALSSARASAAAAHLLPGRIPAPARRPASRFGCEKYGTFTSPSRAQQKRGQRASDRPPPSGARAAASPASRCRRPPARHRRPPAPRCAWPSSTLNRGAPALARSAVSNTSRTRGRGHRRDESAVRAAAARASAAAAMKSAPRRCTSPMRLPGSSATTVRRRRAGRARARAAPRSSSQRNLIGQRMADELGLHAVRGVELGLERQQAQHAGRTAAPMRAHAPLPPGPHLRTHVLHGAQARAASAASRGPD